MLSDLCVSVVIVLIQEYRTTEAGRKYKEHE